MNKSTPTWYPKNQTYTYFSNKYNKEISGKVVKEKTGHIWVQFNKRIHKFKKY